MIFKKEIIDVGELLYSIWRKWILVQTSLHGHRVYKEQEIKIIVHDFVSEKYTIMNGSEEVVYL